MEFEFKHLHYTPVILPDLERAGFSWWNGNFFHYKYGLISAYYGIYDFNFRERIKFPRDGILVADSGGLQSLTQNWQEEVIKILRWQERNADIALTFDITSLQKLTLLVEEFVVGMSLREGANSPTDATRLWRGIERMMVSNY